MKMLRVIAKKDGFRRAGRAWSGTTEIAASEFTPAQITQLMAEPNLVVDEFEVDEDGTAKVAPPAKASSKK